MFYLTVVYLLYFSFFYCESNFKIEMLVFTQNIKFKIKSDLEGENLSDNLCNT